MYSKDRINKSIFSDILILLFAGIVFTAYQYKKNLSPEFFLFFIQLLLLWFFLKTIYRFFPKLKLFGLVGLLVWGVVEATWGLGQLYNYFPVKHSLFRTTGSFFNPGPYGGFIALVLPLALHYWLAFRQKNKWIGYLFLFTGAILLMVLPATLSRTAWIAAVVGCLTVLLLNTRFQAKLRFFRKQHKKWCIHGVIILSLLMVVISYGIYHLKKDSADGRLFMWRITALAIEDSHLKGIGLGGFRAAYANAQMDYFKSGEATATEKIVAGSPEYAFNEYLQLFLEQGILGFMLFLMLSLHIIRSGIRNKQASAAGSFVSLSVFAFASYPYQLWQFPVAWVLLAATCTAYPCMNNYRMSRFNWKQAFFLTLLSAVLFTTSIACFSRQKVFIQARKEWKRSQPLYTMKAYESVADEYMKLYPRLNHEPRFVFEYGVILNATGQREKADSIFTRGLKISSDPMFYNVKGRNHHEMGEYNKAEACYMNSTWLLPGRVYPYFLLTRLYADPFNYRPEKMQHAAKEVLEKEPKVYSRAIRDMQNEVKKVLIEKETQK